GWTGLRGPVERGRDRQLGGLGEVRRNQDPAEWERYRPAHDEAGNLAGSNQTVRRRSQDAVADRPAAVWPDHDQVGSHLTSALLDPPVRRAEYQTRALERLFRSHALDLLGERAPRLVDSPLHVHHRLAAHPQDRKSVV